MELADHEVRPHLFEPTNLLVSLMSGLGGGLDRVLITRESSENTYFAEMVDPPERANRGISVGRPSPRTPIAVALKGPGPDLRLRRNSWRIYPGGDHRRGGTVSYSPRGVSGKREGEVISPDEP